MRRPRRSPSGCRSRARPLRSTCRCSSHVGLVEPFQVGREVRYRALGSELSSVARELDRVGSLWEARLRAIKEIAEGL